jgi:type I restriction enzyme S subunit
MIPPGYKQTEVGVIPEDWEVKTLSRVADIRGGIAKNSNAATTDPISVHYLRVANVQDGFLDLAEMSKIHISRADLPRYKVVPGDVLMNEGGDLDKLGRGAIWRGEYAPCVHQNHVFVVRCKANLLPEYLNIWTATSPVRRFFLTAGKQTTNLASISKSSLGELPVALPSLPEQYAISTALSDVDALIAALDRLIAKKRDLKQAAMQQLLTGQTRLPGFKGEWVVMTLGELGSFTKGSGIKKDESQSGPIPCIRYGEIYTRHHDYIKEFHSFISAEVAVTASLLKQGDILFAGSGETKAEIGKCVAFVNDCEAYAGGDIVILRPQGVDSLFLGFSLNTPAINRQKASRGQGDAVVHIGSSALADISLNLPPLPEQTAIASVLSEMDAELAGLEQRREKTRALKQGMMQELLTGRTRLMG